MVVVVVPKVVALGLLSSYEVVVFCRSVVVFAVDVAVPLDVVRVVSIIVGVNVLF